MHYSTTRRCRSYLLSFCLLTSAVSAQEWTRFRGLNGTGLSAATAVPVQWTEADYNWKVELPGMGHSSPVLWGEKVFVTCADQKTAKRMILCLKTSDGSVLWKREHDSEPFRQHADNSYASASPAVDAERVYVVWITPDQGTLLALTHDGKEVWRHDLGPFTSLHGSGASPMVFEDMVVLGNDQEQYKGFLLAVDAKTGKTRWQIERNSDSASYGTPCVYQPKDGPPQLIFTSRDHGFTSVDPRTGKVNWELADAFTQRVVGSPVVVSGLIIGQCGQGGIGRGFVAIRPDAKPKPEVAYKLMTTVPYVPTPVAKGDLLFLWGDQGVVRCLRAATGEEIWQEKPGGHFYGSPVCVNDRLYCMSTQGDMVVLAVADKYQLLARIPLGESSHATPAIANGVMYLRTLSHLISIGGKKRDSGVGQPSALLP